MLRKNKGITLIVLVVTIVVMIILSTISISAVLGEKGILNKAKEEKDMLDKSITSREENMNKLLQGYENMMLEEVEPTIPNVTLQTREEQELKAYDGEWTNKDIVITLSGDEAVSYQYNASGEGWKDITGNTLEIKEDQNKNYVFRSKSAQGKESDETISYAVKRDTVAPVIEDWTASLSGSTIPVKITKVTDSGGSEIATYEYYHKSSSSSEYILDYSGTDTSYTINTGSGSYVKIRVIDAAGNAAEDEEYFSGVCFVAGTKVLTEKGLKNIEDIKVGEKVWSMNLITNTRELKTVQNTFDRKTNELYEITVGDVTIECTRTHKFYVVGKGWVQARKLKEGDNLVGKNNEKTTIDKIVHKTNLKTLHVYNLNVEDKHNYFVSEKEILVHNAYRI